MAGISSFLLKGLGVLLVFIGLLGIIGSSIGLKMVSDRDFGGEQLREEVQEISGKFSEREAELRESFNTTTESMVSASQSVREAGESVEQSSQSLSSASASTSSASSQLEGASAREREAARQLEEASEGLKDWADSYSYNGTPLPNKYQFKTALSKIDTASNELESSGQKMESTSEDLETTAENLETTSSRLLSTSQELYNTSTRLEESGRNLGKIESPLSALIHDMTTTLENAKHSIDVINQASSNIKAALYIFLSYMLLFHLILLLMGFALIVIEFYISY